MLLAINIGNTRTHACYHHDDNTNNHFTTRTHAKADHYRAWLRTLAPAGEPDRILISSVSPAAGKTLSEAVRSLWGSTPEFIRPRDDLGISFTTVDYHNELGADLFVNAVASNHSYGGSILNVDLGSASTFCVLRQGVYLGTSIVPGLELSIRAMIDGTALLKDFSLQKMNAVIQTNTTACLQSGIYFGYFELVRGMINRIQVEQGPLSVVLTGGIGDFLHDELAPYVDHFRPNLTLEGLELIGRLLPVNR